MDKTRFNLIYVFVAGLEKKTRLLNPREREVVACHEMGHALVGAAGPGGRRAGGAAPRLPAPKRKASR